MLVFHLVDMVNHRTAEMVKNAVLALDQHATVRCEFTEHRLDVEPSSADSEEIIRTLRAKGFVATVIASSADSPFAWVDSRNPTAISDSIIGGDARAGLLPTGALGPTAG